MKGSLKRSLKCTQLLRLCARCHVCYGSRAGCAGDGAERKQEARTPGTRAVPLQPRSGPSGRWRGCYKARSKGAWRASPPLRTPARVPSWPGGGVMCPVRRPRCSFRCTPNQLVPTCTAAWSTAGSCLPRAACVAPAQVGFPRLWPASLRCLPQHRALAHRCCLGQRTGAAASGSRPHLRAPPATDALTARAVRPCRASFGKRVRSGKSRCLWAACVGRLWADRASATLSGLTVPVLACRLAMHPDHSQAALRVSATIQEARPALNGVHVGLPKGAVPNRPILEVPDWEAQYSTRTSNANPASLSRLRLFSGSANPVSLPAGSRTACNAGQCGACAPVCDARSLLPPPPSADAGHGGCTLSRHGAGQD